jgi:hypothetical protein
MDRNESNPGLVEQQLDESPMEGRSSSDTELDRDLRQGGRPVEREGMQGEGTARESMEGEPADERQGGYGYDRPADGTTTARDW